MPLKITECPSCASPRIRLVKRNQRRTLADKIYVVPNLQYWECSACGEQVYDSDAMRKIEAYSPAYRKRQRAAGR